MNSINKLLLNTASESSVVSELRHYHPLFKTFTFQGSRMIFQRGLIVRLRSMQLLFKERTQEFVVYIVLCGRIVVCNVDLGLLGVVGIGESLGEESLLSRKYVAR